MIKWDCFGKLLKPLFTILLIGFFGLLGSSSVNSAWVVRDNNLYGYSTVDPSINLNVVNKGQLMSEKFGRVKRMLAFASSSNSHIYFFRSLNHKPYYLVNYAGQNYQGFLKYYYLCDYVTGDTFTSNCIKYDMTDTFDSEIGNFFDSITINDQWAYDIHTWNCYGVTQIVNKVGFYNSLYNKVIVFASDGNKTSGCSCDDCNNSTNSLGIAYTGDFTFLNENYLNNPPGMSDISSGVVEGSTGVNIVDTYTGDYTFQECKNGKIMNLAEKYGLSPYLCQGGLDNWDLFSSTGIYNPIPGSGKWLDEIYSYTNNSQSLSEWFQYWNNFYVNQYVTNTQVWNNQPAVLRSYFKFFNDYGGNNVNVDSLYEYCLMRKSYISDHSFVSQKYTGTYFQSLCSYIENGGGFSTSSFNNPGETIVGLNWNGVGNLSGNTSYSDPGIFITDMFTKIKSYIPTNFSGFGFLPTYIISFLLFLILFRFISH